MRVLDFDGAARVTEFALGTIAALSMSYLPHVTRVSDLRILLHLKGIHPLEGIEGAVIDLPISAKAFADVAPTWVSASSPQRNLEGKTARDPLTEFNARSLLLPNPRMEFFFNYRRDLDSTLRNGYAPIDEVGEYLDVYEHRLSSEPEDDLSHSQKIRRVLHHEWFFTQDEARLKRRDSMLSQIMKMQNAQRFQVGIPACPLVGDDIVEQECGEDINDKCQATAYSFGMDCATYFLYSKKALKSPEVMERFFNYLLKSKEKYRLIIVNFNELDLHSPPDMRARAAFRKFAERVRAVKAEREGWEFMLMGAGNQFFVALESFDFLSTSFTRIDKIIGWSEGRTLGYWLDERLMLPVPPEDRPKIDIEHCPVCGTITDEDFLNQKRLGLKRKQHCIYELDKRAREMRQNVGSKSVGAYMRQALAVSEFSGFRRMILSP